MRAALTVTSTTAQLHGQVEGSADAAGVITISSLTLTAAPGQYFINVTLPDYPEVWDSSSFSLSPCISSPACSLHPTPAFQAQPTCAQQKLHTPICTKVCLYGLQITLPCCCAVQLLVSQHMLQTVLRYSGIGNSIETDTHDEAASKCMAQQGE